MNAAQRLALLFACGLHLWFSNAARATDSQLKGFVTRRGDQLFEGEQPFRFISFNIPNLQIVEDDFSPDAKTPWGWPNEFELNDALESIRQLGGRVARSYVLSVRREGSDMGGHVYVRGPGDFNEEAFRALDLALEIANRRGVRLIIPLVDNWQWHGGVAEYAAFRGKPRTAFWTEEQVIADFEQTVRFVLTRVNSRTGVRYCDDPAILGWETGNELDCPPQWTARIAALMKKLDPNHLVIDGYSLHGVREESIADPNIDVITTHHYPNTDADYVKAIRAARNKTRGKKPYVVGEFGFIDADQIEQVYQTVIEEGVSGALLWSLRYHHRGGGFYWHYEPAGGSHFKAYHWPGFATGAAYQERRVMDLTRAAAHRIRGKDSPPREAPAAPTLLPISDPAAISWQGSAGAGAYVVEAAPSADGPWATVGDAVDDTAVQYRPLFNHRDAEPGRPYYYRVSARNEAGLSAPSNTRGPISAAYRTLVDEGRDLKLTAATTGEVRAVTGDDRRRREDAHRILIPAGASVTYRVEGSIHAWKVLAFRETESSQLAVRYSADGTEYTPAAFTLKAGPRQQGDYAYLQSLEVSGFPEPGYVQCLELSSKGGPIELSRIEIRAKL